MKGARAPSPQRVGELLTAAVPALSEKLVEETVRKEWARTVPADLGRRSEPGPLRRGVLEVRADNSPWLQELTMRRGELLAALAARHGAAVTSLRFVLAPIHGDKAPADAVVPPRRREIPPRLSPEEAREVEVMAAAVTDPEVAAALRRLLTKARLARRREALSPRAERDSA